MLANDKQNYIYWASYLFLFLLLIYPILSSGLRNTRALNKIISVKTKKKQHAFQQVINLVECLVSIKKIV
jgi:hypothetical protein